MIRVRVLRDAHIEYVPDLARILGDATRKAYTFMAWDHTDSGFLDFVGGMFTTWDSVRLAEIEGRPVGFSCVDGDVVDQLFFASDHQGQGVGALLQNDLKHQRPEGFGLFTFQANRAARRFYEKQGLIAVAFGVSEDENEPDVRYEWKLDA